MKELTSYNRVTQYLNKVFKLINSEYFDNELEMPTITIRIRLDYAWDKSLHVQKMRVPALQTLADASQMFRAVFLTCLCVEAMLGFAV